MFSHLGMKPRIAALLTAVLAVSSLGITLILFTISSRGMDSLGQEGSAGLKQRAMDQLASVRSLKAAQIEELFKTMHSQVLTMAHDRTVIDACLAFDFDVEMVRHEAGKSVDDAARAREELKTSAAGQKFLGSEEFRKNQVIASGYTPSAPESYVPKENNAILLQHAYLGKSKADSVDNLECGYNDNHKLYQPVFRDFIDQFGYKDMIIVSAEKGRVLYSVRKDRDFLTDLSKGPFASSALGQCVAQAMEAGRSKDTRVVFTRDFAPYEPAQNAPVAFMAAPIFDGGQLVGALALEISQKEINRIMLSDRQWEAMGLGKSGQTYLVGPDMKMRSQSRFNSGAELDVLHKKIDTEAASKALDGESGSGVITGPDGSKVMASWQPLSLPGLKYGLIAEIDEAEAMAASTQVENQTAQTTKTMLWAAGLTVLLALALGAGCAFWLAGMVTRPLERLQTYAKQVSEGNYNAPISGNFPGEYGSLKASIQAMVAELKLKLGISEGVLKSISGAFPCLTVDKDCKISFVNDKMIAIAGQSGDSAKYIGMNPGEFFFGDPNHMTRTERSLRDRLTITEEGQFRDIQGKKRIINVSSNPIFDLDGELAGAFTLYFELTQIRHQEAEITAKNEKIENVAQESTRIAQDVSTLSQSLSSQVELADKGADLQRQRTGETALAMEQMRATVFEVASNASEAASNADKARQEATGGKDSVAKVIDAINDVHDQSAGLKETMDSLGAKAQDIGQVMGVISDIADQTNLLALNAAIEAARAGDAGRGFAVVADEVRKLAEKTMTATKEVAEAISSIQTSTAKSVADAEKSMDAVDRCAKLAEESGQALERIVDIVESTSGQVTAIAAASEQQAASTDEVGRIVEDISHVSNDTAEAMRLAREEIGDLASKAGQLESLISEMKA
ncbi:MAG: methyl-accepting chemotaxis protein [Desulfovibrio sp.]|uniref:methyl-accepting chemotaxis protein n=1 Tax=Desulfovibrio sp. 7SRBS1 TaxID=3378064 RepID=UPI003B3F9EA5